MKNQPKKSHLFHLMAVPLAAVFLLSTTSCDEDDIDDFGGEDNQAVAETFLEAEAHLLNIYNRVDAAIRDSAVQADGSGQVDFAQVTLTSDSLTIDYGSDNVETSDGKDRRGKISAVISGGSFLDDQGSSLSIVLEDYHVDDEELQGMFIYTNTGLTTNGADISIDTLSLGIAGKFSVEGSKMISWTSGYNTHGDYEDDAYDIDGGITGTDEVENAIFSANITSPMVYDRTCIYRIEEGVIDLSITTAEDSASYNVDFMSGDGCNNLVRLTKDNGAFVTVPFDGF